MGSGGLLSPFTDLLFGKMPDPVTPVAPQAPPDPQAAKAPDAASVAAGQAATGQAGGSPGVAQTFLTGANGVDVNTLNLKKNTLLGGS